MDESLSGVKMLYISHSLCGVDGMMWMGGGPEANVLLGSWNSRMDHKEDVSIAVN